MIFSLYCYEVLPPKTHKIKYSTRKKIRHFIPHIKQDETIKERVSNPTTHGCNILPANNKVIIERPKIKWLMLIPGFSSKISLAVTDIRTGGIPAEAIFI